MSEWSITKLGDVLEITNGYAFKSVNFRSEPEAGCLPVLKIKNVANGDVHINDVQYHHFEEKLSKYTAQKGDILISLTGNHPHAETQVVGAVSKLKMDIRAFVNQRVAKIDTKPNLADKDYIYFALKEEGLSKYLASQSSGSANQANISKADIEDLDIALPPLPEQKAIASVLSSLDDKIDLLHRQNKTLEAMAETLFRQWFIEEAKEDWEYVELGSVVETSSGGTPSRKEMSYYENGSIHWVKSKELNGSFITETEEMITDEAVKKSSAKLLPAYSTLIAMYGATVGEYALITKTMTCNQAVCALKENEAYPYTFIFMYVKNQKDELINQAVGSAQQNISQILIKKLPVPTCTARINEYHQLVIPWFKKMQLNVEKIQTLENLRDTLLPKLMSGEVRVQYQTEEVA